MSYATSTVTAPAVPQLLTEADAAAFLAMRPATLRRWRWARKGPTFCKIGGAVRYRHADLEAFLETAVQTATTGQAPTLPMHHSTVGAISMPSPGLSHPTQRSGAADGSSIASRERHD